MNKTIKEGYHIEVTTWENDGDNYKTESFHVLTWDQVHSRISLCELFGSKGTLGNSDTSYEDDNDVSEAVKEFGLTEDDAHEYIGTWSEGEYWRNVERINVFFTPKDVTIEQVYPEESNG